jgi:hypothetical protein
LGTPLSVNGVVMVSRVTIAAAEAGAAVLAPAAIAMTNTTGASVILFISLHPSGILL